MSKAPETMTEVMIRDRWSEIPKSTREALDKLCDMATAAERTRCLSIVKAIEPHNEAEAHLIETIVRRMRGEG